MYICVASASKHLGATWHPIRCVCYNVFSWREIAMYKILTLSTWICHWVKSSFNNNCNFSSVHQKTYKQWGPIYGYASVHLKSLKTLCVVLYTSVAFLVMWKCDRNYFVVRIYDKCTETLHQIRFEWVFGILWFFIHVEDEPIFKSTLYACVYAELHNK